MSYMEDNVLAYKAPLYGRRTAQMKILPFDFGDACGNILTGFRRKIWRWYMVWWEVHRSIFYRWMTI